jgi:predicted metal-dependent hydrolase
MIPGRKYSDAEIKDARARFERANKEFDKVLEHLDREISETLRNYWKRQSERAPFILASLETAQLLGHSVKWAGTIGFAFYFHEVLVREAPDSVFHTVIAHELAHALQGVN